MAPSTPSKSDGPSIHEANDIAHIHRPFKNPSWKPPTRRNKNLKSVLADASRQQAASLLASQANTEANTGANTPLPGAQGSASLLKATAVQQALAMKNLSLANNSSNATGNNGAGGMMAPTYTNIEAAPSFHPAHNGRWCDITGLPATYTEPKTKLRYTNKEVYAAIQALGPGMADKYLELRGANVILK